MAHVRKWGKTSKSVARSCLETVLFADRMNCQTEMVELIKRDILAVMDKYLDCSQYDVTVHLGIAARIKRGEKHAHTIQIKGL